MQHKVLILKSSTHPYYLESLEGFKATVLKAFKSHGDTVQFVEKQYNPEESYDEFLQRMMAAVKNCIFIHTIGSTLTTFAANELATPATPVIYSMVLEPEVTITKQENVYGISSYIPESVQVDIIGKILANATARNIGLVYQKSISAEKHVQRLKTLLAKHKPSIHLNAVGIRSVSLFSSRLREVFRDDMAAYLILPDEFNINLLSFRYLTTIAAKKKRILIGFGKNIVEAGALLGFVTKPQAIGARAGEIALRIYYQTFKQPYHEQLGRSEIGCRVNKDSRRRLSKQGVIDIFKREDLCDSIRVIW